MTTNNYCEACGGTLVWNPDDLELHCAVCGARDNVATEAARGRLRWAAERQALEEKLARRATCTPNEVRSLENLPAIGEPDGVSLW